MAKIGDVLVQLRAETAQFQRSMAGAQASVTKVSAAGSAANVTFNRLALDVARATRDFKAGTISQQDYAQAIKFARGEAKQLGGVELSRLDRTVLRLQGNLRPLNVQTRITAEEFALSERTAQRMNLSMDKTTEATKKLGTSAVKARQGLGTIRSSAASLTSRLVGLNGTLGTFAGALGQFAVGTSLTIGIIAGIAAIGFAMRKLDEAARRADRQMKTFVDNTKQGIKNLGVTALRTTLDQIDVEIKRLTRFATAAATTTGGLMSPLELSIRRQVASLIALRDDVTTRLEELQAQELADIQLIKDVAGPTFDDINRQLAEQENKLNDVVVRYAQWREQMTGLAAQWREFAATPLEKLRNDLREIAFLVGTGFLEAADAVKIVTERLNQFMETADQKLERLELRVRSLTSALTGLIRGSRGLDLLGGAIGGLFGFLQGGPLGAAVGAAGGLIGANITPAGLGIGNQTANLNRSPVASAITVPSAPGVDPFTAAANAHWLAVLSESNRALANSGFRFEVR